MQPALLHAGCMQGVDAGMQAAYAGMHYALVGRRLNVAWSADSTMLNKSATNFHV